MGIVMSIKGVHLTLIALAGLLAACVSAWSLGVVAQGEGGVVWALGGASLLCTVGLAWYWTRVRRRLAQW